MEEIRKIESIVVICPKCDEESTITEMTFNIITEGYEKGIAYPKNLFKCGCGHMFIWKLHLKKHG